MKKNSNSDLLLGSITVTSSFWPLNTINILQHPFSLGGRLPTVSCGHGLDLTTSERRDCWVENNNGGSSRG